MLRAKQYMNMISKPVPLRAEFAMGLGGYVASHMDSSVRT